MTRTKQMMEMTQTIEVVLKQNVLPLKALWIHQIMLSEFQNTSINL